MYMSIIFNSVIFWIYLAGIIGAGIYVGRAAIKIHEYERQVDRGWQDLVNRADKIIARMDEIIFEIEKLKKETKPKVVRKTKKENLIEEQKT